jgi:hypothetical protein
MEVTMNINTNIHLDAMPKCDLSRLLNKALCLTVTEGDNVYPSLDIFFTDAQWIEFKNQVLAADRAMYPGGRDG